MQRELHLRRSESPEVVDWKELLESSVSSAFQAPAHVSWAAARRWAEQGRDSRVQPCVPSEGLERAILPETLSALRFRPQPAPLCSHRYQLGIRT